MAVEKPCSHNPREGSRSRLPASTTASCRWGRSAAPGPALSKRFRRLRMAIGKVHYARAWYNNKRPSVRHGQPIDPPTWLGWTMWQGPAPSAVHGQRRPLQLALALALKTANWATTYARRCLPLGPGCRIHPTRSPASGGGKYRWDDDQETPDTHVVTYNFPGNKSIMWEGLSWSPLGSMLNQFGCSFHGETGSIVIIDPGYKQYDERNKEVGILTRREQGWRYRSRRQQLPRMRHERETAERRHRRGPQEHPDVPSRQHRPSCQPRADHRREKGGTSRATTKR